jgi:methyl-accepting chemotaxis protein
MGLLLTILAIGVLISVGISVKIGTVISNKIVDASKEIAEGSQHMMQACEEGAIRSHQLSQGATNMASSIAEEAESVNDCVNNIAEMSHAIQGIISNANTMVQLAKTSTTNATLGNTLADHSINTISKIKSLTTEACHSTQTLNTLIAKLESIVALIKNITEQTNLLALNATIEAVRAGEQGKGFYIVAGEVKELAAQSAEATITVSQLIQQIQAEVKNVVNSIENNTQIVEEGVSAIESVGTNLGEILTVTSQVTLQAEEVSSLLTDSAINPEKLLATMRNISTVIKQSATNTHQMALATQEQTNSIEIINTHSHTLSQTAKTLEELVTAFKL